MQLSGYALSNNFVKRLFIVLLREIQPFIKAPHLLYLGPISFRTSSEKVEAEHKDNNTQTYPDKSLTSVTKLITNKYGTLGTNKGTQSVANTTVDGKFEIAQSALQEWAG